MATGLTSATISVSANTRQMEKDIAKALKTIELSQINTKKSSQALGRITAQVSEFNKSLEASNARVIAFGASAGAIFAVEKALSSLITSTIEVEKKLQDINVLLNLSSSSLQKFGGSLFDIAKNTAQSFSSVAEAATELARQGLGVEETLKRTNAALILARLSGLDTVRSVEALTATLNSFSGSALDAVQVVNKLANVDAAFAVSSADLANAISRVGSTAQDAGVSLDELISIVTAAQQTTARGGAVIGNSLKTIFTRLQRGKVQDLLGSLGVDTSEGQSAIDLLKQLASTYDTLGAKQKSYVAEQVGGVFQINILKAALSDLGKEYSIYDRALETSLSSTDQAIKRNQELNKTLSALSSQAVSNLEEAASKIGSLVFEPNAKGFLSSFNGIIESFNKIDTETQGGKFIEGFFKGISNFIGGPGTVLAVAVLTKLFVNLAKFAAGSAKELLGRNEATKQQAALEQGVLSILQKNSVFTEKILSGKMTTVQAEKQLLDYLTAQSNVMREQERISKTIAANLGRAGVSIGASGVPLTSATGKKTFSSGFVPNFASDRNVGQAMENAGAREHGYRAGKAKKTTIHDGNGKSFKSFVNNKEDVKTFTNAAGKKATVVRPPNGFGENTQYAAGGYIPNFAKNKVESLSSVKSGGDLKKLYDFGIRGKKNSKTDYYSENVSVDRIKLPYNTSTYDKIAEIKINSSLEQKKDLSSLKYKGVPIGNYLPGSFDQSKLATGNKIGNVSNVKGALGEIDTEIMLKNMGITPVKLKNKFGVDFSYKDKLSKQQLVESKVTKKPVKDDVIYAKALTYLGRKANPSYKGNSNSDTVDLSALGVGLNLFESKASGFVPNFASMGSKFKAMYGGGTTMRAVDKEKTAKKKNLDVKKLDLSDRYTMVHGGNQGLDSANVSLEAGNNLFDAKIATAGLDTSGTNLQRYGIKGVVGDALVGATNNIIKTFGGKEQITDASSLDNAGSVGSAAGTVFETALRKSFNAPAVSQTQRIDFPAPTPELKKFFHNAPGQYEAKISRTPDNLKSTLKKWVDVHGLASSASGYIPNFADRRVGYLDGDVLSDPKYTAIVEEQIASLGISGGVAGYHKYLGELAKKSRKAGSLKKFTGVFGVPGAGKSSMMLGGKNSERADNSKFRKTQRIPIIIPSDIDKVDEIVDTRASLVGTAAAIDKGYWSELDRLMILSSSTPAEQEEIKRRRSLRDSQISEGTSKTNFGREAGTSTSAGLDSAYIEAVALDTLGSEKTRIMGINPNFGLKRKKEKDLPIVEKKRLGLAYGAFSPSTKGHLEMMDMARGKGIPPEDFVVAISREGGKLDQNDPHSLRTLVFDQNVRKYLAQKTFEGANVVKAGSDFTGGIRRHLEVDPVEGRRRFLSAQPGSTAFVGSDKTEKDLTKYKQAGYDVSVGSRTEGISGTKAREAMLSGDSEAMSRIFPEHVLPAINQITPAMKRRTEAAQEIMRRVSSEIDKDLTPIENQLAELPSRITKNTPQDIQQKIITLREARDDLKKKKQTLPPKILKRLSGMFADKYGVPLSSSGFVPNFAKTSGLSFSQSKKDEFGFSSINAILGGKKVGGFSYSEDKPGNVDVGDLTVEKAYRGKGYGSALYEEAIKRNKGKKMKGQLLPQMNRLLQKIKNGEPVSAETLYPQIKRADLAKSSMFEVYGHKGMEIEKMTRDQFASFVNAKINELKKDPKKLQSYFGNVEADEYGGLGVDLQTQHASGFVPNFLDIKKDGSLPFGVRGRANFSKPGLKPNIQLGVGATPDTLFHEASHLAYSKATMSKANSNEGVGRLISDPRKYAGVSSIMASSIFKNVNQNELFKSLGFNPVQLDFDGKNPGATYSGAKAVDEITTRIQEKIFKNKGNLASLSANENTFVKNLEGLDIISNKRMSNVSRRSAEGSKFRSLIEGRFSSAMGGSAGVSASGFIPNFADQVRKNMYDWDGTIIPKIRGGEDEYIRQLGSLKERDLLPIGKKLKAGKKKFDVLTSRPPLFEKAIRETSSRLGLPVNKISFGVKPKDKLVEAQKRGSKIVDDNLDLMGKPGFLNARVLNKRLSSGFIPNFSNALNDAIAREQSSGLSKSQIYVDKHSSLKNKNNPMGLMVANRRDEPGGGIQGIKRAKKEGRNPKTYGAASGFIPNFAADASGDGNENTIAALIAGLQGVAFSAIFLRGEMRQFGESIKEGEKSIKNMSEANDKASAEIPSFEKEIQAQTDRLDKRNTLKEAISAPEFKAAAANKQAQDKIYKDLMAQQASGQITIGDPRIQEADERLKAAKTALSDAYDKEVKRIDQDASEKKNAAEQELRSRKDLISSNKEAVAEQRKSIAQEKKQRLASIASQAGMAAQIIAPQIASFIPQNTQGGREAAATVEGLGNIAGMAGTGALIAGPWGAAAGAAIAALMEIPKIEKAFTSKMPELEKAVTAATENFTKFSDSAQQFLNSSQKLAEIRVNPNSSEGDIITAEKQYIDSLTAMPIKYQEQLVAAERLGNAQVVYSEILERLSLQKISKEVVASNRGTYENAQEGVFERMGSFTQAFSDITINNLGKQLYNVSAAFDRMVGIQTENDKTDYVGKSLSEMLDLMYGRKLSSEDVQSVTAQTYNYTKTTDDPSTVMNEALESSRDFAKKLNDIQVLGIENDGGVNMNNFQDLKGQLLNALQASYAKSGGEVTSEELQILSSLRDTMNRPDQLQQWLQEYQTINNKFISGQEKIEEVRKNIAERQKKEAEKKAQDRQRADQAGARVSSAKSEVDQLFSDFKYAMEEGLSKVKFAGDLESNRGNFGKEIYDLINMPNVSKKRDENNRIFSIEQTTRQEKEQAKTTGATSIFESIGNLINSASLDEKATSGMSDSEIKSATSEFELKKTEFKNELIGSGAMNQILQGDTAGAKGTLDALIEKLIASGSFTATQIQELKNKTIQELGSVNNGIKISNRNELQQKALLAQQLAFDRAKEKITQAQNLGGGAEQIIPNLLGAEDSLINQAKDSLSKTVSGGYNVNNLVKGEDGKIIDKNTGKTPALDSLGALTDTLSTLTKFTGAPITSMGDMNFQAISQGYSQMLAQSIDDLEKQSGGALGSDVFKRMRDQVSSLGTDKEGGASVSSNLQLMQKLGVIDSSQYVDGVTEDYTKKEFENLPKELQDAYKGVSGDSKLQFLGINELTKVSSNGFSSVVEAIEGSFDVSKMAAGIKDGLIASQISERKITAENAKKDAESGLKDSQGEEQKAKAKVEEAEQLFNDRQKFALETKVGRMSIATESEATNPDYIAKSDKIYSEKNIGLARAQVALGRGNIVQKEFGTDPEGMDITSEDFLKKSDAYELVKSAAVSLQQARSQQAAASAEVIKSESRVGAASSLVSGYNSSFVVGDELPFPESGEKKLSRMQAESAQIKDAEKNGYYMSGSENYYSPSAMKPIENFMPPKPAPPNGGSGASNGVVPPGQQVPDRGTSGGAAGNSSRDQASNTTNVDSINLPININIEQGRVASVENSETQVSQLAESIKNQVQEVVQRVVAMQAELQKGGFIKPPPPTNVV